MRQSDRAAATRQAILEAARDVFSAAGFSDANIADVVSRAGSSVGSLYHHFGGKADLYLALFEDYQQRQEERAAAAVAAARNGLGGVWGPRLQEEAGVGAPAGEASADLASPIELFAAGSRAYLDGCWLERDLARLFLAGGGPAGFELVARRRFHEWTRLNELLLGPLGDRPSAEALVLVLTTVVSEAGHQVAMSEHAEAAAQLAEDVVVLITRLAPEPSHAR